MQYMALGALAILGVLFFLKRSHERKNRMTRRCVACGSVTKRLHKMFALPEKSPLGRYGAWYKSETYDTCESRQCGYMRLVKEQPEKWFEGYKLSWRMLKDPGQFQASERELVKGGQLDAEAASTHERMASFRERARIIEAEQAGRAQKFKETIGTYPEPPKTFTATSHRRERPQLDRPPRHEARMSGCRVRQ